MSAVIDIGGQPPEDNNKDKQPMALQTRGNTSVGHALGINELKANLDYIRDVMRNVMREGQDYGKIPGTGEKPTLLQPGAQKLLMTFQLDEYVKKEVLREYPGMHREYEFTVAVKSQTGREWDGVGTCSTLESKYRWRKGERKCPECGKPAIIAGKAEYGGGFLCWKRKEGCGAKFAQDDARITGQATSRTENEDPADQWNTVRKMGFKRALVAAAINATNTSELWTQDLDDKGDASQGEPETTTQAPGASQANRPAPGRSTSTQPPPASAAPQSAAPRPQKTVPYATKQTLGKFARQFADLDVLKEFLVKIGQILPTETVEDLPLQYVPVTKKQNDAFLTYFKMYEAGAAAQAPFPANPEAPDAPREKREKKAKVTEPAAAATPAPAQDPPRPKREPEWWRTIIVPIPPRGMRRDEYLKAPQTIGQLYEWRHQEEHAKRLFGFIAHFEPSPSWTGSDGVVHPRTKQEIKTEEVFREALDDCAEYAKKHSSDTEQLSAGEQVKAQAAAENPPASAPDDDDDVPY